MILKSFDLKHIFDFETIDAQIFFSNSKNIAQMFNSQTHKNHNLIKMFKLANCVFNWINFKLQKKKHIPAHSFES